VRPLFSRVSRQRRNPATAKPAEPVVVGLDGGYVRSRHRQDERHFEVIAGKVMDAQGQSRFAFARNSPTIAFKQAFAVAGVTADTPATVLCNGDAGLWRLQREALPNDTPVTRTGTGFARSISTRWRGFGRCCAPGCARIGASRKTSSPYLGFFQFVHNARRRGKALLGALIAALVR
jgi:hypothetical protein